MEFTLFLKGILIGFVLAMSVGPIALLCIANTLERGPKFGLSVGMGASTADGIYATVAALGISVLMLFMNEYELFFKGLGGGFLFYLGWKIIAGPFKMKKKELSATALFTTYISIVGLTLISPMTIAVYMGAFAGMNLDLAAGWLSGLLLGLGAFLGSAVWHSLLVAGAYYLRSHLTAKHLKWLTKTSGLMLCGFGLVSVGSLVL